MSTDNQEPNLNIYVNGNYIERVQGNYNENNGDYISGDNMIDLDEIKINFSSIEEKQYSIKQKFQIETAKKIIDKFV